MQSFPDRPSVDATVLYHWDGLEGTIPNGQLRIDFSVPLGLRAARAALRRQKLIIERDKANLHQGLHNASHVLAVNVRNLEQFYAQYQAFKETRAAARANLEVQFARYRQGLPTLYINVLQAIADWGNSVSSESQALIQYNTELANLERQTGTILETHGIRFYEERFESVGPLIHDRKYPKSLRPGPNSDIYRTTSEPAENFFELEDPIKSKSKPSPKNAETESPRGQDVPAPNR